MVQLIVALVIVGVGLYLINTYVPMDAKIKTILNWVVVIVVILWLLSLFGLLPSLGSLGTLKVGK